MYLFQDRIGFVVFLNNGREGLRGTYRSVGFAMTYALRRVTIVVNPAELQDLENEIRLISDIEFLAVLSITIAPTHTYAYISGTREMEDNAQDNSPLVVLPLNCTSALKWHQLRYDTCVIFGG